MYHGYELPVICTPYELLGDSTMWQDEILDKIHKFREEYAKAFHYDLDAMFADWQKKQAEGGRQVVSLPPKQGLKSSWSRSRQSPTGLTLRHYI